MPFPPTRWSLVGRAPAGEVAALIERYAAPLAHYLRLRFPDVPAADLEDATQEALIHLLERPELLTGASEREGGRFRYYLATLALNQARNALRGRRRAVARESALVDQEAAAPQDVDRAWEEASLAAAWSDLRGWAQTGEIEADIPDLLMEHLAAAAPLRELAAAHGLSLATCQRRIAKGRTWLRKALEQRSA